jgi:branched-chain amino acid transport system permease protein
MGKWLFFQRQRVILAITLLVLIAIPLLGDIFYTRLATRILIYAILALSLDLILGYAGMVSLGHAAFFGVGAYTVAILGRYGIHSAFVVWPLAVAGCMVLALPIGAVSLRTSGTYFIMITLAFGQMLYYLFVSLKGYGGSDGMAISSRNTLAGLINLGQHAVFYYVVLAFLLLTLLAAYRLVRSPFGIVISGTRDNEARMRSLGFPTFRYKLVCFILAAGLAGLAGVFIANHSNYASPALLHWTRSAEVLVMVILGGMGSLFGPLLGAMALLLAEEILSSYTQHWMLILGPLLIGVVLWGRNGIHGLLMAAGSKES